MKHQIILLSVFAISIHGFSQKQQADSAYIEKNYTKAATIYESLVNQSPSSEVFYNLGNAYYRLKDYPRAILNYERSLRLDPSNSDTQHNLALCRTKIQDHFPNTPEMFFFTLTRQLRNQYGTDGWAICAICTLILCLIFFAIFLFAGNVIIRKAGFFSAIACLALSITANLFAWQQSKRYYSEQKGVILQDTELYASPLSTAKKIRDLHSGTTVILQDSSQIYFRVLLPDNSSGWLPSKSIAKI